MRNQQIAITPSGGKHKISCRKDESIASHSFRPIIERKRFEPNESEGLSLLVMNAAPVDQGRVIVKELKIVQPAQLAYCRLLLCVSIAISSLF